MDDDDDTNLMAMVRPDDPGAVEYLVERYGDRAWQLALRITGVEEDAEEAVEGALRMAARTIHSFTDESAIGSWIDCTVAREAYQRRKRRHGVDEIALDDVVPSLAGDGGHFAAMDDWSIRIGEPTLGGGPQRILIEAIDGLPADCRTALVLHDIEGVSKPHIAEILDVDVPAAMSLVHRARLFVRKRLSEYFEAASVS